MEVDPLADLSAAYGRMCVLVASALTEGFAEASVMEASRGKGALRGGMFRKLRNQRRKVNAALRACDEANVSTQQRVLTAKAVIEAVEAEFMVRIPKMG